MKLAIKLFDKVKEIRRNLRLSELELVEGVKIAKKGNWFNTRYDYAEIFGGGRELVDCSEESLRHGRMSISDYSTAYLTATERGHFVVKSEGLNRVIECDTILRISNLTFHDNCKHYYFLNGRDTGFVRDYTPSMGAGMPRDSVNNFGDESEKGFYVERCSLLIEAMGIVVGRIIMGKKTK